MSDKITTPSGAIVETVDFPESLTPAEAVEGTIVQMWGDDLGKLYRIETRRNPAQVNVIREDGKKFYIDISALMLPRTDRKFPVLPDYIPSVGDLVHVRGVRGADPTDVLFVSSVTRGKAKCWLLDNSKRSVSLPFGNLSEVTGTITVELAR